LQAGLESAHLEPLSLRINASDRAEQTAEQTMQEEELYKLATDELNSRNRKADLWARACALATDDVDEARYLYTNLRVEELAIEHKVQIGLSLDKQDAAGSDTGVTSIEDLAADLDMTSALPSEDVDSTPAQIALARAEQKGSDTFSVFETKNSVDETLSNEPLNDGLSSSDGELTLSLAPAGEQLIEDGKGDLNSDLALGDLTQQADSHNDNTVHIDAEQNLAGDLSLLPSDSDAKTDSHQAGSASADLLADLMTDSSDQEEPDAKPSPIAAALAATAAAAGGTAVAATSAAKSTETDADSTSATVSDTRSVDSSDDETAQDVSALSAEESSALPDPELEEDAEQTMPTADAAMVESTTASGSLYSREDALVEPDPESESYGIYSDEEGIVTAVKQGGNNRSALLLTQVWFLSRRMWGMSLVYGLMSLVLVIGLAILIPRCFASGATMADFVVTAGFVGLALLGWFYLPYKFGNDWYELAIRKKGYNLQAIVDAHSSAAAEQEYYMQYFPQAVNDTQLTN